MSDLVKAQIEKEIANLEQVVDFPVEPFGYGTDISCESDLDPLMTEIDGGTTLALAQAIVRRLDTPRGSLPDDGNYGIDVRGFLNRGTSAADVRQMAGEIRNEVLKDDRVDTLTVTVRPNSVGSEITIELAVQPVDAAIGGFALTLAASDADLLLEEIKAAA